jgi:glycosyltransferase involved in cell wall biosynthesis
MVVDAYYPLMETRVQREALALADHGIEVDVICLRRGQEEPTSLEDGVRVYRMPVRRQRAKGMAVQMLEYLTFFALAFLHLTWRHLRRPYDVVQVHNLPDFLVFAALVPKLTGAKVILDLHDLMPEFYAERFRQPMTSWRVRLVRWQERVSCRFADHIITVTELWRRFLIERGQPPDKVTVVMNVADDRAFHRDVTPGEGERGDGFSLIYHGYMGYGHGLDLLLHAMWRLQDELPDLRLTLHGGGHKYRRTLQEMVSEMGLEERVRFSLDALPVQQLARLIKGSDVGVVPYRDGVFTGGILPTKLMEYAALGVPAIAARTPTIREYFDPTMVEFFTPGDEDELAASIARLYRDRDRVANLARNISTFTERYNWSKQSAVYLRLVEQMMGREI